MGGAQGICKKKKKKPNLTTILHKGMYQLHKKHLK